MVNKRDIFSSPRILEIKRSRQKARKRLFVLLFILLICIIIGLSYLSGWEKITINKINVSGTHVIYSEEISKVVEKDLSGKYFYLFYKKNFLIYPESKIYNDLITQFPRIDKLSLNLKNSTILDITLSERTGSYLWCGDKVPVDQTQIGENCYFLNDNGYIFDKAPYFSGNLYFKFYIPLSNAGDSPLTKQILPKDEFVSLVNFIDTISSLGFKPMYLTFDSIGSANIYLENKNGNTNPIIMFSTDQDNNGDFNKIGENFSLAMQKPEFANEIRKNFNNLFYIDLRFKDKILYKFSAEGVTSISGQGTIPISQ